MKTPIYGPARAPRRAQSATSATAATSATRSAAPVVRLRYRAYLGARRAGFAAPSVDLMTLVIADAIKRRAQAEIQRPALRDACELPVAQERNAGCDAESPAWEDGDPD